MTSATRDVIIRLRGELDPSLRSAFRDVEKMATAAHRERVTAAKNTQASEDKARKESARADERETKDSIKRAKDREKALEQSYKAQTRAAEQAAKAQASAASKAAREQVSVLQKQESAHRRVIESQQKLAEATKMTMSGLMSLGRGFAMIGLVGEKDTKKLLEGLIKIQAAFDLLRGGIDVVMGLTRAYRAYQAAVTAAAAAQATLTAAQAVGGAAAAGGAGAGIGKALGAGAIGGLAAKGIGAVAGLGAAGMAAGVGAAVGGGSAILSAGLTANEAWKYGIGGGATPGSVVDTVGGSSLNPFYHVFAAGAKPKLQESEKAIERQASAQSNRARMDAMDQSNFGVDVARQQMGIEQGNEAFARGPRDLSAYTNRRQSAQKGMADASKAAAEMRATNPNVSTDQIELSARKQLIDSYQDEANKVRELNREKIQGHKQILSDLTAEATARRQMVKQLEDEKKSAEERFGSLDSGKQRQVLEMTRRMRAGQDIGRAGESDIDQFGSKSDKEELSKRRRTRARSAGSEEIFGADYSKRIGEERKMASAVSARVKDERKLVVSLEADDAAYAREIEKQLEPLFDAQWKQQKKLFEEAVQRAVAKAALERNSEPAQ